ncbi:DUF938 domain-containing protein [Glaciecola sp. SC05]|uniref:DUF938 domain-containing protein n=1 Tax=Glaciecola sp. SC05 TaxID=1987355 RepID=UPI003527F21F
MQEQEIPFSQACENNKQAILNILQLAFANINVVLEIGSGTGQHAVYFAKHLPHLSWQTADQLEYHAAIKHYLQHYPSPNLNAPIALKIPLDDIPENQYDGFFTANTAHIMQENEVQHMMQTINRVLPENGVFCQYGPFTQNGEFNSQSNADFHQKLIDNGRGGYRDIEELQAWAPQLIVDNIVQMPANNLMLIWQKRRK